MADWTGNKRVLVGGIGSWGTAMAIEFARQDFDVLILTHESETSEELNRDNHNNKYLPECKLPSNIRATNSGSQAFEHSDLVVNCIPTQYIGSFYKSQKFDLTDKYILNGSKGIEVDSLRLISDIFLQEYGVRADRYAHIAGPSHAELLCKKDLTTLVCSSVNAEFVNEVTDALSADHLRVYYSNDVIGTQLGGALKNVVAIAAGIIDGLGFGENTKSALITRGLAEITRLGVAMGANPMTFSGLTGVGDLVVTCMSHHSRNWRFGNMLSQGKNAEQIEKETTMVAEGVPTSGSAVSLANKFSVELPIAEKVYEIVSSKNDIKSVVKSSIQDLMTRDFKNEVWR
ncbi:MAG: NAD(P)H-dependent glycerol-3-phosphate dehydrogenase [Candidatus Kapaibacteriales bacterium]